MFATEVTEDAAPGYFDVIKTPMDFGTMLNNIEDKKYSFNSKGTSKMYHDFLLIMDNCAQYNEDNDEILGEAARLMGLLPIVYAEACEKSRGVNKFNYACIV